MMPESKDETSPKAPETEEKEKMTPSPTITEGETLISPKKSSSCLDPRIRHSIEIREHCRLIERSVITKENHFTVRVLRGLFALRKKLNVNNLRRIVMGYYTHSAQERELLLSYIPEEVTEMETDSAPTSNMRMRGAKSALNPLLPEVDVYLHLLILLFLLDHSPERSGECSDLLMKKVVAQNRRSLDPIAARCYYYHIRAYESQGQIAKSLGFLHSRLRTSTLRNDFEGQAVLINCLLRSYINQNLYDQADKLVNKASFPESASNNEWARYLYYLGRIKAIQLEYSEANKHLLNSLRKAPQYCAIGFRHTVMKLNITVQLLLGDIPERQTFLQQANKKALAPYLQLTQAVRCGDVKMFQEVLDKYDEQFKDDQTYTLILRLHRNVIKTAIRTISLAYSKISLNDVANKLSLESSQDAEYIIAKAIRDGVIEAVLDHEKGWMQSRETTDIYCTREPQISFHQRIEFCLNLHNHSVKAMRFPPKSYNQDLESAEDRREREAQDFELAKEIADDDDDMI